VEQPKRVKSKLKIVDGGTRKSKGILRIINDVVDICTQGRTREKIWGILVRTNTKIPKQGHLNWTEQGTSW
jgi:hypothetical protein